MLTYQKEVRELLSTFYICVVVQFYPWFNFYFPLFLCMGMYYNEYKTKENRVVKCDVTKR